MLQRRQSDYYWQRMLGDGHIFNQGSELQGIIALLQDADRIQEGVQGNDDDLRGGIAFLDKVKAFVITPTFGPNNQHLIAE